ncbi:MAG: hypothetical protein Q6370_021285 [Candidatus Sigynarchaeota archaeon]
MQARARSSKRSRNELYQQRRDAFLASRERPQTAIDSRDDVIQDILERFPDADELYLDSFYLTMYEKDEAVRRIVNEWRATGKTVAKRVRGNMRARIHRKKNFIFEVIGPTGEGKSWLAQNLGFLYLEITGRGATWHFDPEDLPAVHVIPGDQPVNVYLTYDFSTSARILQNVLQPMELVIQDESEKMHGEGSVIEMDNLYNAIRTCTRKRRLNFIFCTPKRIQIPEVRAYFHVLGMNIAERTTLALVSVPDAQDDKLVRAVGMVVIRARQPAEFVEKYETISNAVKSRIQEHGGASAPRIDDVKALALEITTRFRKLEDENDQAYYIDKLAHFREFVAMQDDLGLAGKRLEFVTNRAYWELAGEKRAGDEDLGGEIQPVLPSIPGGSLPEHVPVEPPGQAVPRMPRFEMDEAGILDAMLKSNRPRWELKIEAYRRYRNGEGETQDAICLDFIKRGTKCKARTVGNWIQAVRGEIAARRGELYEKHYVAWATASGLYQSVQHAGGSGGGGHGQADVIRVRHDGVHEVVQLKCYNTSESRSGCTIPIDKFAPEIKRVRILKKQGIPAILIGHVYFYGLDRFREQFIDIDHLPVSVSFPT